MAYHPRALLRWLPFDRFRNPPPLVSVLRLNGVISAGNLPLRAGGLNLAGLAGAIERAFSAYGVVAVALAINSPGGSPVQSALIAGRIRQLSEEKKIPVIAAIEDIGASGGYWLALAADDIYADPSSIVGSVGVMSAGFGFTGLLERLGVERRLHVQGDKKAFLDPFAPEKTEDVARLERVQRAMHERFIAWVRERRKGRLADPEPPDLFSGEFWTGAQARELGLVDGLGDLRSVMRERFGERVRLQPVGVPGGWLRRRLGLPAAGPASMAEELLAGVEARALWARYGL
jgi:signal peptide peptidase SppA